MIKVDSQSKTHCQAKVWHVFVTPAGLGNENARYFFM
jgi:hypothetical protein